MLIWKDPETFTALTWPKRLTIVILTEKVGRVKEALTYMVYKRSNFC